MSITKTSLLTVFLLFHACNSRSLGVLNKNGEKRPSVATVFSTQTDVQSKPSSAESNSVEENEQDHRQHDHQLMNGSNTSNYGVSVTWKVHQQKREDPPPEFNLDYLQARTHPPVHN